jgi:hypothetical protein
MAAVRPPGAAVVLVPAENQTEVVVHRGGRRLILGPVDEWSRAFRRCLGAWPDEIERPPVARLPDGARAAGHRVAGSSRLCSAIPLRQKLRWKSSASASRMSSAEDSLVQTIGCRVGRAMSQRHPS